ncbi:MAG: metallophosphoesterase [Clostridia bacterium]|nr:metallophosphoesterase [Clostridia bacterium]
MTYVVSNLHGCYEKFKELLEEIRFRDRDVMYLLGDLVDYGDQPMELIADISMRYNIYPIAGEHDFTAVKMLTGMDKLLAAGEMPDAEFAAELTDWANHGGKVTLDAYRTLDDDMKEGVIDYLCDMALYEEVSVGGKEYFLTHAGIADFDPNTDPEDYQPEDFTTEPADLDGIYFPDKTLVVGHVPDQSGKIRRGENVIAIDCGVAFGGRLGCLCLETGEEFYV